MAHRSLSQRPCRAATTRFGLNYRTPDFLAITARSSSDGVERRPLNVVTSPSSAPHLRNLDPHDHDALNYERLKILLNSLIEVVDAAAGRRKYISAEKRSQLLTEIHTLKKVLGR